MGYYTHFSLTLEEGPEAQYGALLREIDTLLGTEEMSVQESAYARWYDCDHDMERLSRKYPDITVRVNGDGEDSDDLWQTFWHNGKSFGETVRFAAYEDIRQYLI